MLRASRKRKQQFENLSQSAAPRLLLRRRHPPDSGIHRRIQVKKENKEKNAGGSKKKANGRLLSVEGLRLMGGGERERAEVNLRFVNLALQKRGSMQHTFRRVALWKEREDQEKRKVDPKESTKRERERERGRERKRWHISRPSGTTRPEARGAVRTTKQAGRRSL